MDSADLGKEEEGKILLRRESKVEKQAAGKRRGRLRA